LAQRLRNGLAVDLVGALRRDLLRSLQPLDRFGGLAFVALGLGDDVGGAASGVIGLRYYVKGSALARRPRPSSSAR
jgi:hypothetical protein